MPGATIRTQKRHASRPGDGGRIKVAAVMASREAGQPGQGHALPFRETELKICDLCGWLNHESNKECFVCGWHGHFTRDVGIIHAAVELAVRRYGRLELQHFTDPRTYRQPASPPLRQRFREWLRRIGAWLRG